tara:strand:- start:3986 stop:5350 length:1365 start_codon:yes stop_codon:yes gene_type:complete
MVIELISENKRIGQNFLSILNDIKRRPEDAAKELGISTNEVNEIIQGKRELTFDIVKRAIEIWPLNARDFFLITDDSPNGVKIMRSEQSEKSKRIMNRAGKPFYEYRDTAMSRVALFRPEWIKELCYVDDNDPNNPDAQWNDGHFMHQFTYFIGDVNYYYKGPDGQKKIAVTKTGDSVYGTPFRPHTFTTRHDAVKNGLILALTYGNKLAADTQQELSAIGEELGIQFHLDFSSREKAFSSLLKFYIDASSLSLNELSNRTNISKNIIEKYLDNISSLPTIEEIKKFADALNVQTRDLLPPDIIEEKVLVRDYNTAPRWLYPDSTEIYELIELVNSKNLPDSKALELTVRSSELDDTLDLKMGLHQYVYNVGETPISFSWKHGGKLYNEKINPDDSIYIKPFIPHNFRQKGKLLILRIGSRITGDAQREFSNFDKNDANRAIQETQMWFNPEGK